MPDPMTDTERAAIEARLASECDYIDPPTFYHLQADRRRLFDEIARLRERVAELEAPRYGQDEIVLMVAQIVELERERDEARRVQQTAVVQFLDAANDCDAATADATRLRAALVAYARDGGRPLGETLPCWCPPSRSTLLEDHTEQCSRNRAALAGRGDVLTETERALVERSRGVAARKAVLMCNEPGLVRILDRIAPCPREDGK